tara:strand:+ start:5837 stop:7114 length:1278 start_codon:yes stop_codon:yes gene_type:complete
MERERHSRQSAIKGWDQKKIDLAHIALVGSNQLAAETAIGLTEMGYGSITMIGDSPASNQDWFYMNNHKSRAENVADFCKLLYHEINFSPITLEIDDPDDIDSYVTSKPNVIVDLTNNPNSKFISYEYAQDQSIPFISGSSTKKQIILFTDENNKLEDAFDFNVNKYQNQENGVVNNMLLSSLVLEEIRKAVMPMQYDSRQELFSYNGINDTEATLPGNVFMVGAGGIGSNIGRGASIIRTSNMEVVDFDTAEQGNLGNQFWYFDSQNAPKAVSLANKMKKLNPKGNYQSRVEKFDHTWAQYFDNNKVDLILSCADSNETRLLLQEFAKMYKIPFINSGSAMDGASSVVLNYIPGKNGTISEQDPVWNEPTPKRKNNCAFFPSSTIPNRVAASLMLNEMRKVLQPKTYGAPSLKQVNYDSNLGVY